MIKAATKASSSPTIVLIFISSAQIKPQCRRKVLNPCELALRNVLVAQYLSVKPYDARSCKSRTYANNKRLTVCPPLTHRSTSSFQMYGVVKSMSSIM